MFLFVTDYTDSYLGLRSETFQRIIHLKSEVNIQDQSNEKEFEYKNVIPILPSYSGELPDTYWDKFPKREPLGGVWRSRTVNNYRYHELITRALSQGLYKGIISNQGDPHINHTFVPPIINTVFSDLLIGANLHIDRFKFRTLNDCVGIKGVILESENSPQLKCKKEGSIFADYLFSGLKNNMFIGPFKNPLASLPLIEEKLDCTKVHNFPITLTVINKLFILKQNSKYRIITDLSEPLDRSINDCIESDNLRALKMSTIPEIFKKVRAIGPNCTISKVDLKNAYQQICLKTPDISLHGFKFGGRYFYNTKMVFGEKSSPEIFDNFNQVNTEFAIFQSSYDRDKVFRVLDDTVVIDTPNPGHYRFVKKLTDFCSETNIALAEFRENKAFVFQGEGEVLGIIINCPNLTWTLRKEKREKMLMYLANLHNSKYVSLNDLQVLLGLINVIVLLTPPLRFYKDSIIRDLTKAIESEAAGHDFVKLSDESRDQIRIWINIVNELEAHFPIHDIKEFPSDNTVVISTDAAGNNLADLDHDIGAGVVWYRFNISTNSKETIIAQADFLRSFVTTQCDEYDKHFGSKTSVLEALAVMLALYQFIPNFAGQSLIIDCDNEGLVWAWRKGRSKTCKYLSLLLNAMNYVAVMYSVNLYFRHVKRKTTPASTMADHLTRDDNHREAILKLTKDRNKFFGFPPVLLDWMQNPTVYDNFAFEFYQAIKILHC